METLRPVLAEHPFFRDLEEAHLDYMHEVFTDFARSRTAAPARSAVNA